MLGQRTCWAIPVMCLLTGETSLAPAVAQSVQVITAPSVQPQSAIIAPSTPPPPRVETVPPPPSAEARLMYWHPGHWMWNGTNWIWESGQYVQQPMGQAVWEPGHWDQQPSGG